MKGYKIDLRAYDIRTDEIYKNRGKDEQFKYDPKEVIPNIMLSPFQNNSGFRFVTIGDLAKKIKNCKDDYIILDTPDYEIIKISFDKYESKLQDGSKIGFGKNDYVMVSRIFRPEEIELEEKKIKKEKKKNG